MPKTRHSFALYKPGICLKKVDSISRRAVPEETCLFQRPKDAKQLGGIFVGLILNILFTSLLSNVVFKDIFAVSKSLLVLLSVPSNSSLTRGVLSCARIELPEASVPASPKQPSTKTR